MPRCCSIFIQSERARRVCAARLDLAGEMDRAAEQQQFLGQRRLAGVGMRDDGKGAPVRAAGGSVEHVGVRWERSAGVLAEEPANGDSAERTKPGMDNMPRDALGRPRTKKGRALPQHELISGIEVDRDLQGLHRAGGAARNRDRAGRLLVRLLGPAARAHAREQAAAAPARGSPGADRRAQSRARRPGARSGRGRGVPSRDRLSGRSAAAVRDRHRRMSIRRSPRSPGRSWSFRSTMPATPSTPPMPAGAASTTRSTAPTRSALRPPAAAMMRSAARRVIEWGRRLPRRDRAARRRQPCRRDILPDRGRTGWSPIAAASPIRPCWPAGPKGAILLRHHGLHVEIVLDREHPIGRDRQGRGRRHPPGERDHRDHGLRGQRRRGRCRGEDPRLSQLARADEGRSRRELRQRRPRRSSGGSSPTGLRRARRQRH